MIFRTIISEVPGLLADIAGIAIRKEENDED